MEKLLAMLFLAACAVAVSVGNFWFTFGIWPRNWWSMVLFTLISTALGRMYVAVMESKK